MNKTKCKRKHAKDVTSLKIQNKILQKKSLSFEHSACGTGWDGRLPPDFALAAVPPLDLPSDAFNRRL